MHPSGKIFIAIALIMAGLMLASAGILVVALFNGYGLEGLMELVQSGEAVKDPAILRGSLWMQSLVGFLLPVCVFVLIFYRRNWAEYLDIREAPGLLKAAIAILALLASYPLVQLSFEVNELIPLPDVLRSLESDAAEVMESILQMDSFGSFIVTLLLVGILPAIGEELVFRGILQKQIAAWTKNPAVSVWIAATIFSASHMQFEGFLPRLALGLLLGYIYLWSRNLWLPILVHAVNNGSQVAILYFSGIDMSDLEAQPGAPLNVWMIMSSVVVLYLCHVILRKPRTDHA